jgi:hypothetical protein
MFPLVPFESRRRKAVLAIRADKLLNAISERAKYPPKFRVAAGADKCNE